MHTFLHIPKTGGTAIKHALLSQEPSIKIKINPRGHNIKLQNLKNDVIFVIRDPWERFCSGFWERKTFDQRKELSETQYSNERSFGYLPLKNLEKQILQECDTPNDFLNYLMKNKKYWCNTTAGIFEMTASITHWLGDIESFKKNEHKVVLVFDIKNLHHVMKERYGLDMPNDPFKQRSRRLFKLDQSYDITSENLSWFQNSYRNQDYQLLDYVRSRPYFYGSQKV